LNWACKDTIEIWGEGCVIDKEHEVE